MNELTGRIAFIQEAERLKNVLRSAHTSTGRRESTAEHTWRLCLMALTFEDQLGVVDFAKILKLCVVHDLGEAISGDVPATEQQSVPNKSERERQDLQQLTKTLPAALQAEFLALWEDYEYAISREARIVKALDKLETIIQHNQGQTHRTSTMPSTSHTAESTPPLSRCLRRFASSLMKIRSVVHQRPTSRHRPAMPDPSIGR